MASIRLEDIRYFKLPEDATALSGKVLLENEIEGASVLHHTIPAGKALSLPAQENFIRILFLLRGNASFLAEEKSYAFNRRAVFTALPETPVTVRAEEKTELLEIRWELNAADKAELASKKDRFPFAEAYEDALQYRDPFKSETTVSRAIIIHDFIPRFAMGSVEAKSDDLVGQHAHPLLDQFFFSLSDNDADLLVDCRIFNFKDNTLIHIPLGSNHGVIAKGNQKMHYLWLDFIPVAKNDAALAYLNENHTPTGVKETV